MKNLNQEELSELSQIEVVQIEGGDITSMIKPGINAGIDMLNKTLEISLPHWS